MDPYRLILYREDGRVIAPAMPVSGANDAEAIAKAEAMHGGPFAAELLDVEGLRIIRYLPANGERLLDAAECSQRSVHRA
jgi:hypothetical protein